MRRKHLLVAVLLVLGSVASLSATKLLDSGSQIDPREQLQILFVLDSSSSMRSPVIAGETPDDLSSLVERLRQIENSPEYLELVAEMQAIEEGEEFSTAAWAWEMSIVDRDTWLADNGYGRSMEVISESMAGRLSDLGCNPSLADQLASAQTVDELGTWVDIACVGISVPEAERSSILDLMAFLENPEYGNLTTQVEEATQTYLTLIDELGYSAVSEQLTDLLVSSDYRQLSEDLEELARTYGFPTRLSLSKEAVQVMVDLAVMDGAVNNRNLKAGLVTFSDTASVENSLADDPHQIRVRLSELEPAEETNLGLGLQYALDEIDQRGTPEQPSLIILLSDGQANLGSSPSDVIEHILPRAKLAGTPICTLALAASEERIDANLLMKIAEETGGEYSAASSLEQVPSFFMNCRRRAAMDVVAHSVGIVHGGDQARAAQITVPDNICALQLTMRYSEGGPFLVFADPGGYAVDETYAGATRQTMKGLQLLTILSPKAGMWTAMVRLEELEPAILPYSLLVRSTPCEPTPTPILPTPTPTPSPLVPQGYLDRAWPYLVGLGLLALAGLFVLVVVRREQNLMTKGRGDQRG